MTDPKRSLRVPESPGGPGFRPGLAAFLPTARAARAACLGIPTPAPFLARGCSLALTPSFTLGVVPSASPCVSRWPSPWLPLSLRSLSPSPWPQANFPILLAGTGLQDHKRGSGPRELSARGLSPPRRPSRLDPASPARSHLVSPDRAAAAAAIYARRARSWSFKRRFPGARRGPASSLMAPVAANHTPLPPPARPAGTAERLSA